MDFLHWDGLKAVPYRNCRNILFLATLVAGACATKSGTGPTMGL